MSVIEFCRYHLDRVSRSFARISEIDDPLRTWMSLSYLICRIADSIEDTPWPSRSVQDECFELLCQALEKPSLHKVRKAPFWEHPLPELMRAEEKDLMNDAPRLFGYFHELPPEIQAIIRPKVREMCAGMSHYCHAQVSGALRLANAGQLNDYCFYVAGLVGEILTRLIYRLEPALAACHADLLTEGHHFGLFLQKINILKDQPQDEASGRFFVADRSETLASLLEDAEQAFLYLEKIPIRLQKFRIFCAWALFLGLASLPYILKKESVPKIPREMATGLYTQLTTQIDDNEGLKNYFQMALNHAYSTL